MARRDALTDFVEAALTEGRSRAEIRAALAEAGWTGSEADEAMAAFADIGFTPPVPRPRPVVSARDFFTYAMILISLGIAAVNCVMLAHELIDRAFGVATGGWSNTLNWAIANLAVFTPIYVYLSRREAALRRSEPARHRSAIRRWVAALILLVTLLILLADLALVIFRFLEDGLDIVFLLKAAAVAAVSGGLFWGYRQDRL